VTSTSRIFAVMDALVSNLPGWIADATVAVIDGPQIVDGSQARYVVVGSDDADPRNETRAGTIASEWAGLGARARDENVEVDCAVVVFAGDEGGFSTVRDAAGTILAAIETGLRTNAIPGLSGVLWQELTVGDVYQANTNHGPRVRIPFTVHARSRI
jgi:hypothetical protein